MAQVTWSTTSNTQPAFVAEQLLPDKMLPGGARLVASAFPFSDAVTLTLAAGVITAGTNRTLTVTTALTGDIPAGEIVDFGSGEFATLTNGATKGTTSITGVTLAADLEGGEVGIYPGGASHRVVPAGVLVGRTFTERAAGTGYGPAVVASDEQIFLTAFQVEAAEINPDVTLLRHGTLIYEDKLPGWATMAAGDRAAIRSRYQCIASAPQQ